MRDHLPGDGPFESAPFGVAGGDQPSAGLGQLVGAMTELFHLTRQFGGQPDVAEGHPGLVGQVRQQPLLPGTQRVTGRHLDRDASQPSPHGRRPAS